MGIVGVALFIDFGLVGVMYTVMSGKEFFEKDRNR
jgi:hypothetical protein